MRRVDSFEKTDAGRDWGQEEKEMTEDEMAGWHHWLDGHESEWTPGVGNGQRGLACCDSWGHKESDTTEQLNWTELNCLHRFTVWEFPELTWQVLYWFVRTAATNYLNFGALKHTNLFSYSTRMQKSQISSKGPRLMCWQGYDSWRL